MIFRMGMGRFLRRHRSPLPSFVLLANIYIKLIFYLYLFTTVLCVCIKSSSSSSQHYAKYFDKRDILIKYESTQLILCQKP